MALNLRVPLLLTVDAYRADAVYHGYLRDLRDS
jgi:hypothetical protein